MRLALFASLMVLGLGGCSILPEAVELEVYSLPAGEVRSNLAGAATGKVLRISKPMAAPVLGSARIVVMPQAHRLSVYKGARWSDSAPALLRDRLIEAFRQTGRLAAVVSDDARMPADLELAGELLAFQSEYRNGQPVARIRLQASLLQGDSRRILASHGFEVEQSADSGELSAVVEAFGRAGGQVSGELVEWVLAEMRKSP